MTGLEHIVGLHDQGCPCIESAEYLINRRIKANGAELEDAVKVVDRIAIHNGLKVVAQGFVLNHASFGITTASRCVHHVG